MGKPKLKEQHDRIVELAKTHREVDICRKLGVPQSTLNRYLIEHKLKPKRAKRETTSFDPFSVDIIDFDMYAYRMGKQPLLSESREGNGEGLEVSNVSRFRCATADY